MSGTLIQEILHPEIKDLGGFSVRRLLPSLQHAKVGPWVFFDHFGPAELAPGPGINVRPHPHIGIATVSYLFEGEIFHRDSLGNAQAIVPGDINLMVAGRGIVHSERERPEAMQQARQLHGLQLWLALPEEDEEAEPSFHHYPATDIPVAEVQDVPLRVMMGSAWGLQSPVKTFARTLYVEASLRAGQQLELPDCPEQAIYVARGEVEVDGTVIPEYGMAVIAPGAVAEMEACENSRIAIIGGEPMGKRHLNWNFVSSRRERISQARDDWKHGRFPKVPGDEEEFIPLPE